ncbi:redox-regulated ATPase YchF [Candidatus Giovannonibacteria bacterium RIFCSPLOWO2_12_FULL_44_25]|uniref:GTP-binding protein YchF n=3 Tax=Parcubacteria group TaxID=1794811 RepID=A0A837ILG9_9BACT|nr:MAG: GTP-binding protein YchF [Parcubacteria group bacterium GW2011_GWC1_44_10]KKT60291.1 MAG: GTP-binding protein YchF [Candidatus Giovannonibacteria bacterium GW2011_GWA1_44_25]KKU12837.1 MAG: GTP-binding protein YchF [Candidatus Azambacteria bacterium GW2011_GWC2_45_7b]KKU29681.1 MAG: GTP-binding protein YchF [Candidatus Giovannonibacteria bacterium GW2011_GWB1_46_20]OGF48982.1 MAG: redox-regulated ATPase YchF [Candidatus Giovannonibacteria bacterium GWA2_45_15]OGF60421.1 MAG: redox-regu
MKIGIVGLPNVGKSTLFQALTKKQVDTSNYPFATIDPNVGVVQVPDERLEKLAAISHSKKIIPAIVEFVDIAGLVKGAAEGEGLGNKFLSHIREVNAICHIVRAFENENIVHISGKPNPLSDIETIKTELALKDLETVAKIKANAQKEAKSGKKEAAELVSALENFEKIPQNTADQYQLLSFKPTLYVFNVSSKNNLDLSNLKLPTSHFLPLDIGQENDISAMPEEERKELGIQSQLPKLIKAAYELLGLITFFTTGEDESRAWTIPAGSTAKHAGRAIHSDFEEKFIRADVIFWEKLIEANSWSKARELGWLRSEGKEYIVRDGDVIEFKI